MLGGSLVTKAWRVLRLRMLGRSLVTKAWRVLRLRMLGGSLVTKAWRVPQVADGGHALQFLKEAANILNKLSRTADKGWSSSLGVGGWAWG
jgi:hypothetical protein